METKLKTEKVLLKKEKLSVNIEQIVENDMSLPDYYGDIVKILGCTAQTNVYSAAITGDKAVVDGNILIRTLYVNSSSKTEVFECAYPFNRSIDVKDASDTDVVSVATVSEQMTCRAVNQRRADIRGSVSLRVSVAGVNDCNIITDASEENCHTLKKCAEGSFLVGSISKSYTLSTSVDTEDAVKTAKLYRVSSLPVVNEVKTIKNKMMIKGGISVDAVFIDENGGFASQKINLPFNQITDMDGIDEESKCCVSLSVRSVDLRLTSDATQARSGIEISAIVSADIDAYKNGSVEIITEAYSPACELICTQNTIPCVSTIQHVSENYTVTSNMDFSSSKVQRIADASVRRVRCTVHGEGREIVCKGNLHFGLIAESEEGEKLYFERIADFEYKKQLGFDMGDFEFEPEINVSGINSTVSGNSETVITTELHIDGFIRTLENYEAVTFIEKGRETVRDASDAVITVYFASAGERLWDIAKQHGSSVELIQEMNDISDDTLAGDCMLIFPLE